MSTNRARASRPRQGRRPRPLPPGSTLFTPDAAPARQEIEQRSAAPLLWLHQLPAWLPPVLAAALLVTGLAVRDVGGAVALAALAVALVWLAALSWPRLSASGRALRVVVVCCVLAAAVFRALHG